jgi:hypothetical protein
LSQKAISITAMADKPTAFKLWLISGAKPAKVTTRAITAKPRGDRVGQLPLAVRNKRGTHQRTSDRSRGWWKRALVISQTPSQIGIITSGERGVNRGVNKGLARQTAASRAGIKVRQRRLEVFSVWNESPRRSSKAQTKMPAKAAGMKGWRLNGPEPEAIKAVKAAAPKAR